jgi:hypothetical protein
MSATYGVRTVADGRLMTWHKSAGSKAACHDLAAAAPRQRRMAWALWLTAA